MRKEKSVRATATDLAKQLNSMQVAARLGKPRASDEAYEAKLQVLYAMEEERDPETWPSGKIEKIDDTTLEISELPINSWTKTYTDFLGLMNTEKAGDLKIESYTDHSSETEVAFTVKLSAAMMKKAEKEGLENFLTAPPSSIDTSEWIDDNGTTHMKSKGNRKLNTTQ